MKVTRVKILTPRRPLWLAISLAALLFLAGCLNKEEPEDRPGTGSTPVVQPVEIEEPTRLPEQLSENPGDEAVSLDGEHLALVWTYESGGAIHQPPLRLGNLIVAVPAKGPVTALNVETGAVRWRYDPPERVWERAYASDGELLFVGLKGGRLVALDLENGQARWEKELGINVQVPPLVSGAVIYVPTTFVGPELEQDPDGRAKLFALNAADGQELWVFESDNYILQTPFQYEETLYLAGLFESPEPVEEGGNTRLYALSAADGAVRWTYESEDGFPKSIYATDAAVAFIGYQDFASGVDAATGALRWREDTGNWVPALTGQGDVVFFGSANTVVHALDISTGTAVWRYNIPVGTFNYLLGVPVFVDQDLIFLTQHGDVMALDVSSGALRWQYPTGIEAARTGLTVSGEWLFIGGADGILHAYRGSAP